MRDVTAEVDERMKKEKMGQQTIEVTNRVIEKQMRRGSGNRVAAWRNDGGDEDSSHEVKGFAER